MYLQSLAPKNPSTGRVTEDGDIKSKIFHNVQKAIDLFLSGFDYLVCTAITRTLKHLPKECNSIQLLNFAFTFKYLLKIGKQYQSIYQIQLSFQDLWQS